MDVSRTIAVTEAVVVLLPLTLHALWGVPVTAFVTAIALPHGPVDPMLAMLALGGVIGLGGLGGAWVLMLAFIRGGPQALGHAPKWAWWLSIAGAGVAIGGAVEFALHGGPMLALGLLALVPLLHLVFERRRLAARGPGAAPPDRGVA